MTLLLGFALGIAACAGDSAVTVKEAVTSDTAGEVSESTVGDRGPETTPPAGPPTSASDTEATFPSGSTEAPATPLSDVGAVGVGDSFYPEMGNGGYDVQHYVLQLDVDVELNRLDAVATISAVSTQNLATFNLDLHGLEVASVLVDDAKASFERDADELTITPAEAIADADEFTVSISYSGSPQAIEDPGVLFDTVGWQNREGVVYVASEPSGAKSWFPSNNHPSDKATFTFEITADATLTAVANGVQTELVEHGDTATTTWVMDDPMTTYLAAIYVGEFERRESTTESGLVIRNYFPPALADDLEADFDLTGDVIAFFAELFGADYPFDEYGSIVVPFRTGFALENQTISLHGIDATDPDTIAHEILHQWVGDSVTVAQWQDIWMLEGFATYLSFMYFEDRGLDSLFDPTNLYRVLESAGSIGPAEIPVDELFGLSVYFRGGMALHALRTEVGDDAFRTILRTLYERNQGERVSTVEFQDIVAELAGADALDVLDTWLFGDDLPPFPT